jgi:hypothetical protein
VKELERERDEAYQAIRHITGTRDPKAVIEGALAAHVAKEDK